MIATADALQPSHAHLSEELSYYAAARCQMRRDRAAGTAITGSRTATSPVARWNRTAIPAHRISPATENAWASSDITTSPAARGSCCAGGHRGPGSSDRASEPMRSRRPSLASESATPGGAVVARAGMSTPAYDSRARSSGCRSSWKSSNAPNAPTSKVASIGCIALGHRAHFLLGAPQSPPDRTTKPSP